MQLKVVGLTGGIAAGKSTVARLFAELGFVVVDADALARTVVQPGRPAHAELVEAFGREMLDAAGRVDRGRLAELIFSDDRARRRLEAITHPAIVDEARHRFERIAEAGHAAAIYEATLLVESGRYQQLDLLVVVTAEKQVRIRRLCQRDGIAEEAARKRLAAQLPQSEKIAVADYLIDNSGLVTDTAPQVERVYNEILHRLKLKPQGEG